MTSTTLVLIASSIVLIGGADLFGGIASRVSRPITVAAWSQAAGIPVLMVIAAIVGGDPTGRDLWLGALAGVGSAVGVACLYVGFARSALGVVAPTSATVAAIVPIGVGLVVGERPSAVVALGIALGVCAIVLVGWTGGRPDVQGLAFGAISGAGFGLMVLSYAGTDPASGVWSAAVGRVVATAVVLAVVLVARIDRDIARGVRTATVLAGVLAAVGLAALVGAAQDADLVLLGVALGMFPTMTALLAATFLAERLRATQWIGIATAACAVTLVSLG